MIDHVLRRPVLREMVSAMSCARAWRPAEIAAIAVGALGRAHLRPRAVVERLAGGGDGGSMSAVVASGTWPMTSSVGGEITSSCRARGCDPLAADEELVPYLRVRRHGSLQKFRGTATLSWA